MIYNLKYINDDEGVVEFSWQSQIVISSTTGFTENFINLSISQGINQIGGTVQGQAVQPKDIVLNGEIIGKAAPSKALLLNTIKPMIPSRLVYNDEWEIRVLPSQTPIIESRQSNSKFQISLKAPYPYWNRVLGESTTLSGIEPMFKFPWNLTLPWKFSSRIESYFINVVNSGNIEVPFRIVFTAVSELSNPKITNAETLEYFRIIRNMKVGEKIIVDITNSGFSIISQYQGVETDIFGNIDIDSNFYRLHVGDNIIRYDADTNRDGLDVIIYHSVQTVGVFT